MINKQLNDSVILLRPLVPSDAEEVFEAVRESITELVRWMPWCHEDYALEESRNWINACMKSRAEGTAYEFGIFSAQDGSFLGGGGLNHIRAIDKTANLGYWVRPSRTKQGVGTRSARLLADYGFKELGFNRIEIIPCVENLASRRVAQKVGARLEGTMRNRLLLQGTPHDAMLFSLIPGE